MSAIRPALPSQLLQAIINHGQGSAKIDELKLSLDKSQQTDDLTVLLKDICNSFLKATTQGREDLLMVELQSVLVEDMYQLPFKELLLGSDGYVYGKKLLYLHFDEVPEEFQDCSPLNGDPDFHVDPHEAANTCVEWIEKYGTFSEHDAIADAYDKLKKNGYDVPLPTPRNTHIRKALRDQVNYLRNKELMVDNITDQIDSMGPSLLQDIQDEFALIHDSSNAMDQAILDRLDALKQKDQQWATQLAAEIALLDEEIARLEANTAELDTKIDRVGERISEAERETLHLNKVIQEIRVAISKAKKAKKNRLLKGLLFFGAQIAISFATGVPALNTMKFIMGDIAKGVVGYGLSRARLAPAIKTILGSAINGGINAPFSGMHIGEGFMRGQVYGLTSLGIGCMEIRSELAQDAMQGVAGATVFSTTVPTVGYLTKNGMAATAFGEVSRKANMPVSASVSTDDKLNVILSA